jgi:hypothetical protein
LNPQIVLGRIIVEKGDWNESGLRSREHLPDDLFAALPCPVYDDPLPVTRGGQSLAVEAEHEAPGEHDAEGDCSSNKWNRSREVGRLSKDEAAESDECCDASRECENGYLVKGSNDIPAANPLDGQTKENLNKSKSKSKDQGSAESSVWEYAVVSQERCDG